ncbi:MULTISPECIES: hypothetical protein [unclassified Pseudomonas]|jgi:hypothetical protein|uniref:hypothetical protein n=1 Tax=unclassified Pseudomonas TaxID=196821 RepID=UPI0002701BEF|nr:hypothetical protein [Pseudomonas sp. GM30]EUB87736.1 hypothetical protein PMI25_003633 [Pseudomonas sp. GM30]
MPLSYKKRATYDVMSGHVPIGRIIAGQYYDWPYDAWERGEGPDLSTVTGTFDGKFFRYNGSKNARFQNGVLIRESDSAIFKLVELEP